MTILFEFQKDHSGSSKVNWYEGDKASGETIIVSTLASAEY